MFVHSTLRQLQVVLRSSRFWATFAIIVAIFAFTGPYGTGARMGPALRTAYWLTVHAVTWAIAITLAVMADILLRDRIGSMFTRMMTGSVLAAVPISLALAAIDLAFTGTQRDAWDVAAAIPRVVPLCVLFCLLTYLTMSGRAADIADEENQASAVPSSSHEGPPGPPPLLARLRPENRGAILHMTVEDHYTAVTTSRGRELILLRFADALREVGPTPGLQVHRSHWVADAHVHFLKRGNGRLSLIMKDGAEIPVSRPNLDAVRMRFGGR